MSIGVHGKFSQMPRKKKISNEINKLKGRALKRRRKEIGLSRPDLATKMQKSLDTIGGWERGDHEFDQATSRALTFHIKAPADFLERIAQGESYEAALQEREPGKQEDPERQRLIDLIERGEVDRRLMDSWLYQAELDRNLKKSPSKRLSRKA